jgi:hypothetical protein
MRHLIRPLARRMALVAVFATVALALVLVPTAFGDGWARDRADAIAMQGLDPAISTAIAARSAAAASVASTVPFVLPSDDAQGLDPAISTAIAARSAAPAPVAATPPRVSPSDDGFAWGAAALGLATGIATLCAVLVCVSLFRHDGRLRNA